MITQQKLNSWCLKGRNIWPNIDYFHGSKIIPVPGMHWLFCINHGSLNLGCFRYNVQFLRHDFKSDVKKQITKQWNNWYRLYRFIVASFACVMSFLSLSGHLFSSEGWSFVTVTRIIDLQVRQCQLKQTGCYVIPVLIFFLSAYRYKQAFWSFLEGLIFLLGFYLFPANPGLSFRSVPWSVYVGLSLDWLIIYCVYRHSHFCGILLWSSDRLW